VESSEGRKIRFSTESRRSANNSVNENFQVPSLRLTPGVPIGFERLLQGLTDRFGILALSAFRAEIGIGQRSSEQFRTALKNCDVKLSRIDFAQVMAHMTTGETFSSQNLINIITPDSDDFKISLARQKFDAAFGNQSVVAPEEIAALYPSIETPLLQLLHTYSSSEDGMISREGFALIHSDLYHSVPVKYKKVVSERT
jgi:hypothetical protein